MSQAPSMPLFCGDYLGDTMHLSLEEHGAYLKLLMITWRNAGVPIADDDARIARMLGITVTRWTAKLRPVIKEFFDLSDATWRHHRLEKEWSFVANFSASQAEKGKKSAAVRALKRHGPILTVVPTGPQPSVNPQPQPHKKEEEVPPPLRGSPPEGDADDGGETVVLHGARNGRSSRGTRLPLDWQPDEQDRGFAIGLGLDDDAVAAEFRDYWHNIPGSKGRKLDWSGTWRNRCREVAGRRRPAAYPGAARSATDSFVAALRSLDPAGNGD